jgi:enoyl-CoA hydratase/carnithine racemase
VPEAAGADDRTVLYERRAGIGMIVLNRPESANALNTAMRRRLQDVKAAVAADPEVRAVLVTGAGRHFSAGADLRMPPAERAAGRRRHPGAVDFSGLGPPVIAVINGAALGGGCELALTCDFRFMAAEAQIGLTEIRFGVLPLGGGTARLPRLAGPALARRMVLTGEPVSAQAALRAGLVDTVAPRADLLATARAFAGRLAAHPARALRDAKVLLDSALETDLATALERERMAGRAPELPGAAAEPAGQLRE